MEITPANHKPLTNTILEQVEFDRPGQRISAFSAIKFCKLSYFC